MNGRQGCMESVQTTSHHARVFVELNGKDLAQVSCYPANGSPCHNVPEEYGAVSTRGRELAVVVRTKNCSRREAFYSQVHDHP